MPNYCNYSMRVVGRPEDVDFFIRELNQDYDYAYGVCSDIPVGMRHFCRVFEANESTSSIFREKIDTDKAEYVGPTKYPKIHKYYKWE